MFNWKPKMREEEDKVEAICEEIMAEDFPQQKGINPQVPSRINKMIPIPRHITAKPGR